MSAVLGKSSKLCSVLVSDLSARILASIGGSELS